MRKDPAAHAGKLGRKKAQKVLGSRKRTLFLVRMGKGVEGSCCADKTGRAFEGDSL